jgi:O-antigen/teichoic acid export membrane protein
MPSSFILIAYESARTESMESFWKNTTSGLGSLLGRKGIFRNSAFAFFQTGISIGCLFLSYRILIQSQGIGALGLWSFLIAFSGIARVFDVGGGATLARFVARQDQDAGLDRRSELIHTLLLTSFLINLGTAIIIGLFGYSLVLPTLEIAEQKDALKILPWIIAIMLISPLNAGASAAVDGLQRADLRSMSATLASIFSLLATWILVPRLGVAGFAFAQILLHLLGYIFCWWILRRAVSGMGYFPTKWRLSFVRETLSYTVKVNGIGLMGLLFEPLVKLLIGARGGTVALGIYELASRLIVQLRSLVLGAAMPLFPLFSSLMHDGLQFSILLQKAFRICLLASLAVCLLSLIGTPVMSYLVLGHVDLGLLTMGAILTWGWSLNVVALPFYLAAQASGYLFWNFISHLALAACVVLFGFGLSTPIGSLGVAMGVGLGLVVSMIFALVGNAIHLDQTSLVRDLAKRIVFVTLLISGLAAGAVLTAQSWIGIP